MNLRRRVNCVYRDYPPYRTGDLVGLLGSDTEGEDNGGMVRWLGLIDRNAARAMPGAKQVMLDFSAYQLGILDRVHWIPANAVIVGCLISEGALAVTDGDKPLIKRRGSEPACKICDRHSAYI